MRVHPGIEVSAAREDFASLLEAGSARAVVVSEPESGERDTLEDDDPICRQAGVEIAMGRDQPSSVCHTTACHPR